MKSQARAAIGKRIQAARLDLGLKQAELADILKVEPSAVSRWESGKSFPSEDRLPSLGAALHKDASYFTNAMSPPPPTVESLLSVIQDQERRIRDLNQSGGGPKLTSIQREILAVFAPMDDTEVRSHLAAIKADRAVTLPTTQFRDGKKRQKPK